MAPRTSSGTSTGRFRAPTRPGWPCALTEVFEIPHPGSLMYKAFDKKQRTILVPTLGLKREEPAPPPEKPREDAVQDLRALVLEAVREGSGNPDLGFTRDGDVALRFGSAAVYVRVLDDPLCVRMFSPVLEDVEADDRLLDRLNELNASMRLARFFVVEGRVIVVAEMFVAPFVAEHVKRACVVVGSLADEFGGMLQKEFGGRRAFEDGADGVGVQ
ncbi:MAG: YbjN domain-containing protein [Acidobacteria bacterium]|nr:YbjN domain-containing protein [Acidobacteriota bacterium]